MSAQVTSSHGRSAWCAGLFGLAAATAFAFVTGVAEAKKPAPPPAPPPPPGPVDTGTIFYGRQGLVWAMNPDGSGKTALPAGILGDFSYSVPSRDLHGGHRWFLTVRKIAGETYDGNIPRREIFAVRDDGAVDTQLTLQPDLQPSNYNRWSPGDTSVSWSASRWVGNAPGPFMVYRAVLVFDGGENVTGLASQPTSPVATVGGVYYHDWATDGTRLVLEESTPGALWIADVSTGVATRLFTSILSRDPAWSSDGARIAFRCFPNGSSAIRTIAPSGGAETTVVATATNAGISIAYPLWSPNGINLAYRHSPSPSGRMDVYRVGAPGSTPVNLTAELDTSTGKGAFPLGWR